ncbi:MAG: Stk1 family PASTA domain-containing Ser/Thr kinase [Microbacterium sp.]
MLSDRYRVDELIGRGGMASVFRGYDLKLGRTVAIKILEKDLAADSTFRTRFRLEAQAASRMAHPSIVRVFDAGEDSEQDTSGATRPVPYIVMELVEGTQLKDILANGAVKPADAVRYVDGILEALEYSHRAGVVHRDIKPGNVMVTPAGQVKVMDFGIARAVSDSSSTVAETTSILGTAAYFSPEQAKGDAVDARADLYSTGIVLYELLTGRPPFRGDSPVAVAYQHVSETPTAPSVMNPALPKSFDPVVLRALAKDPEQRFTDAADFRARLDLALDGPEPSRREVESLTNALYGPHPQRAQETDRTLRQLTTDATMTRTQSGPPIAWIWTSVVLVAVLVAAVVFWVVKFEPFTVQSAASRVVEDVTGVDYDKAAEILTNQDLVPTQQSEASETVPEGDVIRTDPKAGVTVAPGQEVDVYVSTGPQTSTAPDLAGMTEEEARQAISDAKLTLGAIWPTDDQDAAKGTVLSAEVDGAEIAAGDELQQGATVDLKVATGKVQLQDVTGFTVDSATEVIEGLGLTATISESDDCSSPPSTTVASVNPVGEVDIASEITLTVCTGDADSGSGSTATPSPIATLDSGE